MFVVQETEDNKFTEIVPGASILKDDVLHAWQITELWTAAELQDIGVFKVEPAPAPHPAVVVKGYRFERVEGGITQILDIELPSENTLKMVASARQIRLAMNDLGLRDEIETYVASQPIYVRDSWQYTTEFVIDHPFIVGAQQQLNKSDDELIALFTLAQSYT